MTFDAQVQSLTNQYIVPKVTDDVISSNVLALIFMANGRPWMGEELKFPIKLSQSTQGGSFSDYDEFLTNNENVRQIANFDPRAYYQSCVIGGIARSVNNISKTQLLNLVKVEMESIHQDMTDSVGTLLNGDGTGNSNKDFLGLKAGIDDGTGVATYGGLSRATYAGWKSILSTSVGTWDFTKARTLWNNATVGTQQPDLATANKTTFAYLETHYTAVVQGRYDLVEMNRYKLTQNGVKPASQGSFVGGAGFDALYFAGTPIVKDDKASSGMVNAMNTSFYRWYGITAAEATPVSLESLYTEGNDYDQAPSTLGFAWTGFVRPAKQYSFIGQILLLGNLITPASRLQSSAAGITG